ncbi:MAG TPA: hypothetical protein VN081_02700 [Dongiaceae bacterium]|nr:hypothetical protein [Dongiaceae bacterium]
MDSDKNTPSPEETKPDEEAPKDAATSSADSTESGSQEAPADALSKTPDELEEEAAEEAAAKIDTDSAQETADKKLSPLRRLFKRVNIYLLIFILLLVVAGAIAIVNYLNSQKAPTQPNLATQTLSQDSLKQLANTDASVGNTSQTLTIQGNAIINGQTLTRGALNVAGNFQTGGSVTAPNLTISGTANLGSTQVNSLQVAQNTAIQGTTTVRDLNVSGASSFSGAMTASQITVARLILSGNATLEIPNHLSFTGSSPSRSINSSVLGSGGTASINGSDTTGTLTINTGNNPTAGCFAQITFQQVYTNQPHVIVTPIGGPAGLLQFYVNRSSTSFSICSNNAATANQTFAFDYFITN